MVPLSSPPTRPEKLNLGDTPRPPAEGLRPSALPGRRQPLNVDRLRRVLVFLLSTLLAVFLWAGSAGAQTEVEIRASSARGDFPNGVVFTLEAAGTGIEEVRLVYEIAPDGVPTSAVPECTGGAVRSCTFELGASRRNLLIPGAELTYFWRLTVGGETQETEPQRIAYEDDRFEWEQVSDGNLTLWWYERSEDEARAVLAAGRESLDRISALLQTQVDFPVKIFYYATLQDMQPAIISNGGDTGVVTLGEVVYSDTAMVAAEAAPEEIARHEIAHIVVRQAVGETYDVPDWLNEGTAVFAQSEPLPDQQQAVDLAIRTGRVLSVRSLSSASSGAIGSRVSLFYGQSGSLVNFLVDTYGEAKFAQLFRTFSEGASTADALEEVYGFNQDGLENAWRESVGLPPREAPTPDEEQAPPTEGDATPEPETTSQTGGDDGAPVALVVAVAALTVVLIGVLVGAALVVARRYR